MKTVEEYALWLVTTGARDGIDADMNESEDITDEGHAVAVTLARNIVKVIEENLGVVLLLAGRGTPCECALLPLGDAPVEPCVNRAGHKGMHRTRRGVQWADPDDGED